MEIARNVPYKTNPNFLQALVVSTIIFEVTRYLQLRIYDN